jgi:hypothetical protein
MAQFSGGILDIPGLVPVNIGSSAPYPVPFAPKIRPPASQAPAVPNTGSGGSTGEVGSGVGSYSGIDQYTPTFGSTTADPMFVDFPGYGSSTPDFFGYGNYAPEVNPAQLSGAGSIGLGGFGDRLSSLTNAPYLDDNNYAQGAVNAASWFAPIIAPLAGLAQGFNLWDGGETTTNAGVDLLGTPGALQSGTAYLANQVNQLFGGTPMGREHTSGSAFDAGYVQPPIDGYDASTDPGLNEALNYLANPYDYGFGSALAAYSQPGGYDLNGNKVPTRQLDPNDPYQNAVMSGLTLDQVGGSGYGTPNGMPATDPYSLTGDLWNNNAYASFDTRWGNSDPINSSSGWAGPGFGALDRGLNPFDTN